MEQVVTALLEQLAQANATIVELSKIIADLREQPVIAPAPMEMGTPFNFQVTETEEDAIAAYNAGEITKDQLEETLKEIQFFNSEITVPSGSV